MKASEEVLNNLHGVVATTLALALGEEEVQVGMMAQAIKFLKDNDITASMSDDENLHTLSDALKEKRSKRKLRIVPGD